MPQSDVSALTSNTLQDPLPGRCALRLVRTLRSIPGHLVEGVEIALVGFGQGVEVFLGGLDVCVPEPVHHRFEGGCAAAESRRT